MRNSRGHGLACALLASAIVLAAGFGSALNGARAQRVVSLRTVASVREIARVDSSAFAVVRSLTSLGTDFGGVPYVQTVSGFKSWMAATAG